MTITLTRGLFVFQRNNPALLLNLLDQEDTIDVYSR